MQPHDDDIRRQVRDLEADHQRMLSVIRATLDRLWHDDGVTSEQRSEAVLGSVSRRRLMTLGGVAILSTAFLAACSGSSSSSTPETTTTSTPGSAKDVNLLRAASSLEQSAVAAYQSALDSGLLTTDSIATAAQTFQTQHKDHAQLFQNATEGAGGQPFTETNPALMRIITPRLAAARNEADIIALAYDLERLAAATYQADVSQFDNILFNQKVMSVGGIEARHVSFYAPLLGKSPTPDGAFQSPAGALAPGGI